VDIVVTHGAASCANGPQIVTDKSTYAPGSPITVATTCGSGNPKDWVASVSVVSGHLAGGGYFGRYAKYLGSTTPNATVALIAPNAVLDRDLQYEITWYANDGWNVITKSPPFTVPKTINPPAPTATLPTALAADPFVPQHVITVCASGCNYASLGAATDAAYDANWDNVQIKISSDEYVYPARPVSSRYPAHLWIKGIGTTYPHLTGATSTSGSLIGNSVWRNTGTASLTIDNLEVGPWNYWVMKQTDGTTWTLRNVYVRDGSQGLITGNSTNFTLNIYNSVFARSGSGNGPEHDVYIGGGAGNNTVNVLNSVFEQPITGHAFKERAKFFNASCSMFLVNEDDVYLGSETIDMDSGQPNLTDILSVNGAGSSAAWTNNSSWDNLRYAVDYEEFIQPLLPSFNSSVFVADQPNSAHWFITVGEPLASHVTWNHNMFVWPDSSSRAAGAANTDATGALDQMHSGNVNDVTLDGTNSYFTSRAAAGLPAVGAYPKGWRDFLPLMPKACTDPIGFVAIPAN
jgi:hypothetical protein